MIIQLPSEQEIQRSLFFNPKIEVTQYNLRLIAKNLAYQKIDSLTLQCRISQCTLNRRDLVHLKLSDIKALDIALTNLAARIKDAPRSL